MPQLNKYEKSNKPVNKIIQKDFIDFGIIGVVNKIGTVHEALVEAGYDIQIWELLRASRGSYEKKENRINALISLVKKLDKPIIEIQAKDFRENGMTGLLEKKGSSPYLLLKEAGYDIEPWDMKKTPMNFFKDKDKRLIAIKKMVIDFNKPVNEITLKDFKKAGLGGLIIQYDNSPYLALKDAGFDVDKLKMQHNIFSGTYFLESNHGHIFRSALERDFDNIMWNYGVKNHNHNVSYPGSKKHCDFVTYDNRYWIEIAGLSGIDWYDKKIKEKQNIAQKHNLELIIIYEKDFYNLKYLKKLANVINDYGNGINLYSFE